MERFKRTEETGRSTDKRVRNLRFLCVKLKIARCPELEREIYLKTKAVRIKQYSCSFNPTGQCKRRFSRIKSPLAIAVAQDAHFWLASSSVYLCVADTDWFTSFPPFAARPSTPCFIHSVWLTDIVRSNFQSFRKHDLPAEVLSYRWLFDGT